MQPLAEVLRPKKLTDFVDQEHLIGKNGPIKKAIENNNIYSMIFWGTPGCGKTTLARIIANEVNAYFIEISPTTAGVKDIKQAVEQSKSSFFGENKKTILFVDEIHRFNKAQQDYLLPHVENGDLVLIGATTENPSFSVVSPLLSRTRVYKFNPISEESIRILINKALDYINNSDEDSKSKTLEHSKGKSTKISKKLTLSEEIIEFLIGISNGDARNILNALEILSLTLIGVKNPSLEDVKKILQQNLNRYDKKGDEHYDTISAFIKSMRAGDANAAIYYLAKMIDGGEDPKFIARRMVIFASEDIGLANNNALMIANEVLRSVEILGYPECRIPLAHGVIYLAKSPKNRSSYDAIESALKDIQKYGNLPIPLHIKNPVTKLMKDMNYGKGYEMYPENPNYLPEKIKDKKYL